LVHSVVPSFILHYMWCSLVTTRRAQTAVASVTTPLLAKRGGGHVLMCVPGKATILLPSTGNTYSLFMSVPNHTGYTLLCLIYSVTQVMLAAGEESALTAHVNPQLELFWCGFNFRPSWKDICIRRFSFPHGFSIPANRICNCEYCD
jgi:hypothetical protein